MKDNPAEVCDIDRRVWATPLVALIVAVLAMAQVAIAYAAFMLIPLVAYVLSGKSR